MDKSKEKQNPFISIIIPCRNEEKYIGKCLDSIIAQDYPKDKLEVLVVDGRSEDRTREIAKQYIKKYPFIKLIHNLKKRTVFAFNIGIENANGEYITILNAHSTFSSNRFTKSIEYIERYKVDGVGAVCKVISRNNLAIGKAIAYAYSSPFGAGSLRKMPIQKPKLVDTASGCLYKKEVFDKIGLFNEKLLCSQDMEFNRRLVKTGRKILIVPDIVTHYYARSDFKSFCKHNLRNGVWAILPFKYSDVIPVSLRHLVPLVFVLGLIMSGLFAFFPPFFLGLFLFIVCSYLVLNLYFSSKISFEEKNVRYLFLVPVVFTALHISYGFGSVLGVIKLLLPAKKD